MSSPQDPRNSAEAWEDRLSDQALWQVLGDEQPPDLTQRILAAASEEPVMNTERQTSTKGRRLSVVSLITAACLLVGLMLFWPHVRLAHRVSSRLSLPPPAGEEQLAYPAQSEWEDLTARGQKSANEEPSAGTPAVAAIEEMARLESGLRRASDAAQKGGAQVYSQNYPAVAREGVNRVAQRLELTPRSGFAGGSGGGADGFRDSGRGGDRYAAVDENDFIAPKGTDAVSTFSIDVDTASYANVRQFLLHSSMLPPPAAVRIEELINYFGYDYEGPAADDEHPFAADVEVTACPWQPAHQLVRVALQGKEIMQDQRPLSNLVFLVDVSGSMNQPNKLPLVMHGLRRLAQELGENDRVAIVVYASSEGLVLPSTSGDDQRTIIAALDELRAGGSTAGGAGIKLAYKIARENFIKDGVNRVILCTDGDFNVGVSDTAALTRLAEQQASEAAVFLTVLGFGRGNLNDEMMESISNKGNGNYHYIDNEREAQKVLVEERSGTLVTIAKDVKIQLEFNPAHVQSYRLIGYENRMLAREDFNDDTKDAGEIGAGHSVTALYEIVPVAAATGGAASDGLAEPLKYQTEDVAASVDPASDELLTIRLRYKQPDANKSTKLEFVVKQSDAAFAAASEDFKFAAAVASFGMLLRHSQHAGEATFSDVLDWAVSGQGADPHGYRAEFLQLVKIARNLD